LTAVTNHIGQTKIYQYDLNRNLSTLTNSRDQDITFTYDAADRLVDKTTPPHR
jgi:YD repeat-containing protein